MRDARVDAVTQILLRDGYLDNELDARRAARQILQVADELSEETAEAESEPPVR